METNLEDEQKQRQERQQQEQDEERRSEVLSLMSAAMKRSYAHGLARIVLARHLWIRLMWAAVFCTCIGVFLFNLSTIFRRLMAGDVATYFDQSGEFEFPDVYLCNNHPVSGSYHTMLNDSQVNEINGHLNRSMQLIMPILNRTVTSPDQRKHITHWASRYAIYSLPYRLWADWLGARQVQSVIHAQFRSTVPVAGDHKETVRVTTFHHHAHPSCFRIELSREAADALRCTSSDSNTGIELLLFLDPPNDRLQSVWNSKKRVRQLYMPDGSESLVLWDWSLSESPAYISPGLRVFLAPRGHYPSQFVSNFLLSPGAYHKVSLHAEEDYRDKEEFKDECVNEDSPDLSLPLFRDPYTGSLRKYQYSYFACVVSEWQKRCAKHPKLFNRSLSQLPKLEYVYNLTGLSVNEVEQLVDLVHKNGSALSLEIGKKVVEKCVNQRPCGELRYTADISSASFPGLQSAARFVQSLRGECESLTKQPGLSFLFNLANRSIWNASRDERQFNDYLGEAFVRLHFSVSRGNIRRIIRTLAYKSSNFLSDTGGIMGLYLGMSVMALCELIEVAYELLLLRFGSGKNRNGKIGQTVSPGGARLSVGKASNSSWSSSGIGTDVTDCSGSSGSGGCAELDDGIVVSGGKRCRGDRSNSENRSISGVNLCDYF